MAVIDIKTDPSRRDLFWFGALLPLFVVVLGVILWRRTGSLTPATWVWSLGGALSAVFALWPASRRRIYVAWMYAVFPIGWVVSHVLLGIIYFLVITPIGLVIRLAGRDPLERGLDPARDSYWVPHAPADRVDRYLRQF